MKKLFVGGETTNEKIYLNYYNHGIQIINAYGPTESSVCVTTKEYTPGMDINNIGQCIPNMQAYVIDKYGRNIPDNAIGELAIKGIGVFEGYLDTNPNSNFNNGMYKTGDLVKRSNSGDYIYLGRKDNQVKISGYRIELDEIKNALLAQSSIKKCVVNTNNGKINAYYVGTLEKQLDTELPYYMLPTNYTQVDDIPQTLTGKVDYAELEKLRNKKSLNEISKNMPLTENEKRVLNIVRKNLGLNNISIDDNFYSLGGNSIDALKVADQLNVSVEDIISSATLKTLSTKLKVQLNQSSTQLYSKKEAEMTWGQRDIWITEKMTDTAIYNIPFVFRLKKKIDVNKFEKCVRDVVERHAILHSTFDDNKIITTDKKLKITHKNIEFREYINSKFDLSKDIPVKANLFNDIFVIVFHHIAFDGWSTSIFFNELSDLYLNKNLPPIQKQFIDYAEEYSNKNLEKQVKFWNSELKEYEELKLPLDRV